MRFEVFVAARYLKAKRRQAMVGVITLVSVAGVTTGVASLVIALAITNGMRHYLQDRLLGASPHVELVSRKPGGIQSWRPLLERLRRVPHVSAAAPALYGQVLISRGPRAGYAVIKGIVPAEERTVSNLLSFVTDGSARPLDPGEAGADISLVLGASLATRLGAHVGDDVLVISPNGSSTPHGFTATYQRCRVAGIFHSGFSAFDTGMALMRVADAQRLFGEPDIVSAITFKVDDVYQARAIGLAVEDAAGSDFIATNWMEQNSMLFRALRLEQTVIFIVVSLIVVVAALNILIALTMMVMEKTRDIAVLMSFGVEPSQIRRIFVLQGLLISVTGTALGLALGYLGAWTGGHYHFIHLSQEVYAFDTLPFASRPEHGLLVAALSIGISLLATLYPAWAASRILPAEALRYE
ncbi:MAG: FtsX-like permease family protein [Terracidiphilus sp.]